MLQAVLNGKAARVSLDGQDVSWRELFRKREDLLTAAFFGRFLYLSPITQYALLAGFLPDEDVSESSFGKLLEIEFWPRLAASSNSGYVEPDVLVCFERSLLVIEVKPPAGGQQMLQQWRYQVKAVLAEKDVDDGRQIPDKIHLLALGGEHEQWRADAQKIESEFLDSGLKAHTCEWQRVYTAIIGLLDQPCLPGERAVFQDLLQAFHLYGINPPRKLFIDVLNMLEDAEFGNILSVIDAMKKPVLSEQELAESNQSWIPLYDMALKLDKESTRW